MEEQWKLRVGKTLGLFMAKTCLVVFDSKNFIGSISKCLHVWKHSYHTILFSLEQSKETLRIQCWKQVLLWGCCLGCRRRSMHWHWILGKALWRPLTWKKSCQQIQIPFPEVSFQFSDAMTVPNPHQFLHSCQFFVIYCEPKVFLEGLIPVSLQHIARVYQHLSKHQIFSSEIWGFSGSKFLRHTTQNMGFHFFPPLLLLCRKPSTKAREKCPEIQSGVCAVRDLLCHRVTGLVIGLALKTWHDFRVALTSCIFVI